MGLALKPVSRFAGVPLPALAWLGMQGEPETRPMEIWVWLKPKQEGFAGVGPCFAGFVGHMSRRFGKAVPCTKRASRSDLSSLVDWLACPKAGSQLTFHGQPLAESHPVPHSRPFFSLFFARAFGSCFLFLLFLRARVWKFEWMPGVRFTDWTAKGRRLRRKLAESDRTRMCGTGEDLGAVIAMWRFAQCPTIHVGPDWRSW